MLNRNHQLILVTDSNSRSNFKQQTPTQMFSLPFNSQWGMVGKREEYSMKTFPPTVHIHLRLDHHLYKTRTKPFGTIGNSTQCFSFVFFTPQVTTLSIKLHSWDPCSPVSLEFHGAIIHYKENLGIYKT